MWKPLDHTVYATASLLVTPIVALNLTAITLRGRLERLY